MRSRSQLGGMLAGLLMLSAMAPSLARAAEAETASPPASLAPTVPSSAASLAPTGPTWERLDHQGLDGLAGLEQAVADGTRVIAIGSACPTEDTCRWEVVASDDGLAWTRRGTLPNDVARVGDLLADGDSLLVVGDSDGTSGRVGRSIWRSLDDGVTWHAVGRRRAFQPDADGRASRSPAGNPYDLSLHAAARGPRGIVAVGSLDSEDLDRSALWRSADGSRWQRIRLPRRMDRGGGLLDVAASDEAYVVVGGDGLWRSTDGRRWRAIRTGGPDEPIREVESTATGFIALAGDWPRWSTWTSADGRRWQRLADDPALANLWEARLQGSGADTLALGVNAEDPSVASVWRTSAGSGWAEEPVLLAAEGRLAESVMAAGEQLLLGTVLDAQGVPRPSVWRAVRG